MSALGELNSVQAPMVGALVDAGWSHVPGNALDRAEMSPFVDSEVRSALLRLNPEIAAEPERVEEIMALLVQASLASVDDGLVAANRKFTAWLRGEVTHRYVTGTHSHPVRLIDFDDLDNNTFVVSDEVRFGTAGDAARFDLVLWVNGLPLAVGELKTPTSTKVSWMKGATELVEVYQKKRAPFFVPNVIVFASEGKEFRYAGVGSPVQHWEPWGAIKDSPKLADVLASTVSLLDRRTLLDMLADFTLFETNQRDDGTVALLKLVARYTQYEAVSLIVERAKDPDRRKGLIYHTQGSGKTLAMVLAAGKLLRDPAMQNPTVVLVADRVQLVQQMWDQFRTTAMPRLTVPDSAAGLRTLLRHDQRGLIFTTVHKFAEAPLLNERSNIIVMVDEAHRTQEGDLGISMRRALPNANLFAFTGTPIADADRNTFATFGDETDPGHALHSYGTDQSIRDGMTVPIHVSPRKVEFTLDSEALDEAFDAMAVHEGLTDEEQDAITARAARASTFFGNPDRIGAVCSDIVEHFYSTVDPLGMKAQIVVVDRAACVAYTEELRRLLQARYESELRATEPGEPMPGLDEVGLVMTVGAKGEDEGWAKYHLSAEAETALLKRFRTLGDRLKFLVCTSKLGTGFNAPIEGVMYLDKPLKDHTLFQTITRVNRPWRNPVTGADKRYGIIVDYVGLGSGFAKAMAPANPDDAPNVEIDGLIDLFVKQLADTMARFAGINTSDVDATTLQAAQNRLPTAADETHFAANYTMLEGIWEALSPHESLSPHRGSYRFLSQVYASIQPTSGANELLWHRLGVKTLALVHAHMRDITVTRAHDVVVADAETVQQLLDEGIVGDPKELEGKTASDVLDSIAARLKKKLEPADDEDAPHPVYRSLAERLEKLRERTITAATQSIEWLREAFELARDVAAAEHAEATGTLHLLPDPNVGALTQIFREFAPDGSPKMIERVVTDVDAIVKEVRYDGWADIPSGDRQVRRELRGALRRHGMVKVEGLFDRAYAYIAEHY